MSLDGGGVVVDTYPEGAATVIRIVSILIAGVAAIELVCALYEWPSIAESVDRWSQKNQWFAAALLLVVGIFFAHFLLNPVPCPDRDHPLAGVTLPERCLHSTQGDASSPAVGAVFEELPR